MQRSDVIVIGGGIAGLSAAAEIARVASVTVLEREQQTGYHSSGRSATYCHFGIGNAVVRGLTFASQSIFDSIGAEGIAQARPALFVANPGMVDALDALEIEMRRFSPGVVRLTGEQARDWVPVLRGGPEGIVAALLDGNARKLDAHLLMQHSIKRLRGAGGALQTGVEIAEITRGAGLWHVIAGDQEYVARVLVNAAGAWADEIARMASVTPLGLTPFRRTIIAFDPPEGLGHERWPFIKTAVDEFYMLPEAGRLLASPVDEVPSDPTDAQPDDYDIALAAHRVEEFTSLQVHRIDHRWAGLRTFTSDRSPALGFAADSTGFFWLAGQGGFGLQTSPAMARAAAALIANAAWPDELAALGITRNELTPARFVASTAA